MPKDKVNKSKSASLRHNPIPTNNAKAPQSSSSSSAGASAGAGGGVSGKNHRNFALSKSTGIKPTKHSNQKGKHDDENDDVDMDEEQAMPAKLGSKIYAQAREQLREEDTHHSKHAGAEDDDWEDDEEDNNMKSAATGDDSDEDDGMIDEDENELEEGTSLQNTLKERQCGEILMFAWLQVMKRMSNSMVRTFVASDSVRAKSWLSRSSCYQV
jgi:TATA-binding protein-associated factor Taf7